MKAPKLFVETGEGFILGISIYDWEVQIGLIFWLVTIRFRK